MKRLTQLVAAMLVFACPSCFLFQSTDWAPVIALQQNGMQQITNDYDGFARTINRHITDPAKRNEAMEEVQARKVTALDDFGQVLAQLQAEGGTGILRRVLELRAAFRQAKNDGTTKQPDFGASGLMSPTTAPRNQP